MFGFFITDWHVWHVQSKTLSSHSSIWVARAVAGKVCLVHLTKLQKVNGHWILLQKKFNEIEQKWQNDKLSAVIKMKLLKTFSPMNIPSLVTALTVASTTT